MKFSPMNVLSHSATKIALILTACGFLLSLAPVAFASGDIGVTPAPVASAITQFTATANSRNIFASKGITATSITIAWTATNSTYCTLNGQQLPGISGTLDVFPPAELAGNTTYTFNLHCVDSATNTTSDAVASAVSTVTINLGGGGRGGGGGIAIVPTIAGFSQACGPVSTYSVNGGGLNTSTSWSYPTDQSLVRTPACISFCSSVAPTFNYQRCSTSQISCSYTESYSNPACSCTGGGGRNSGSRVCTKPGPYVCEVVQSTTSSQNLCRDFGVYWPAVSYASLVQKSYSLIPVGNQCDGGQCSTDSYGMSRDQAFSFMLNNGGSASTLANDPKSGTVNYLCKTYGGANTTPEGYARGPKTSGRTCFYVGLGNPGSGKQADAGWSCDPSCDSCGGGVATAMCSKPADTQPPAVTISASPSSVVEGASSKITWSTSHAVSCTSPDFQTGGATSNSVGVPVYPTSSKYRYAISCTSASGITVTNYVNIGVQQPISSVSCSVSPSSAYTDTAVTWSSTVTGGQTPYSYSWSGTDSLSGSSASVSKAYTTLGSKSASVTVTDANGSTKTVNCANAATVTSAAPTASLSGAPSSIFLGGTSLLTWSSTNAGSCTGSGFSTGGATSGTKLVGPTTDTNYAVTCTNTNTSATASKAIMVAVKQPSASISSSAGRVKKGDTVTISWSAQNVTACTITGSGIGTNGTKTVTAAADGTVTGSQDVVIEAQSNYVISCQPTGQSSQGAAVVNLAPDFQEF